MEGSQSSEDGGMSEWLGEADVTVLSVEDRDRDFKFHVFPICATRRVLQSQK